MRDVGDLYGWLLLGHVLAGMLWVGGVVMLAAVGIRALRSRDPGDAARFVPGLRVIGPAVLAPAPVIVLGLGLWMVGDSPAWDLGQAWIRLALAIFAAVFVIGVAHQSRAGLAAERAVARGDAAGAARHLRRWAWGMVLIAALLVVATWDMIFRPGL